LKIKLGKSSSLSPDDSIEIKENRLRQRGTDSSANHVSGSRVVSVLNHIPTNTLTHTHALTHTNTQTHTIIKTASISRFPFSYTFCHEKYFY